MQTFNNDITFVTDIRKTNLAKGRSINLALSERGITALKEIGLDEIVLNNHTIPMKGRLIHSTDGKLAEIPYDAIENKVICIGLLALY